MVFMVFDLFSECKLKHYIIRIKDERFINFYVHFDLDDYFNTNLYLLKIQNIQSHLHIHCFLKFNFNLI